MYNDVLMLRKNYESLKNMPSEFQIGFLKGLFDAEGSVHKTRRNIRLCSKNPVLVSTVKKMLNALGIGSGMIHRDKRTDVLTLNIYGKPNLQRFARQINFSHPQKLGRLERLLSDPQN